MVQDQILELNGKIPCNPRDYYGCVILKEIHLVGFSSANVGPGKGIVHFTSLQRERADKKE